MFQVYHNINVLQCITIKPNKNKLIMIAQTKIFAPQQLLLQILQYFLNFCHNFSS